MAVDVNKKHEQSLSALERLAVFVTERVGTMGFFFIIAAWTGAWLLWNSIGPRQSRFDPFPAFVLWLFISNLIQIHLMPLIMIGQNLQFRRSELRAESDYQTDKKAEEEIKKIQAKLVEIEELLKKALQTKGS